MLSRVSKFEARRIKLIFGFYGRREGVCLEHSIRTLDTDDYVEVKMPWGAVCE